VTGVQTCALPICGLPFGRICEIYGPESSGKTTLTLQVIAEAQKIGKTCAFVDAEHALDPSYAEKLGVNVDDLLVSQPDTGEQALEITDMLVRSNAVDVIIIDSVAALTPKAEIEGEMGDHHVGLQARLLSQAMRKITGNIKNANCLVIFINQIRMKIGVMFGSPETTTGGNALKFYSSVRLDIRRIGAVKNGDEIVAGLSSSGALTVGDLDNDGDLDLLIGGLDNVRVLENTGSCKQPAWTLRDEAWLSFDTRGFASSQSASTPDFKNHVYVQQMIDIDLDGMLEFVYATTQLGHNCFGEDLS
jgi:RecA/RadA recombinase